METHKSLLKVTEVQQTPALDPHSTDPVTYFGGRRLCRAAAAAAVGSPSSSEELPLSSLRREAANGSSPPNMATAPAGICRRRRGAQLGLDGTGGTKKQATAHQK